MSSIWPLISFSRVSLTRPPGAALLSSIAVHPATEHSLETRAICQWQVPLSCSPLTRLQTQSYSHSGRASHSASRLCVATVALWILFSAGGWLTLTLWLQSLFFPPASSGQLAPGSCVTLCRAAPLPCCLLFSSKLQGLLGSFLPATPLDH